MHTLLLLCKCCLFYRTVAFLFPLFSWVSRPASKSNCPHSVLLTKDKSWELGNIFSVYFRKHPSNLLPFLTAHYAATGLNTCLQLLNKKKPAEEIY